MMQHIRYTTQPHALLIVLFTCLMMFLPGEMGAQSSDSVATGLALWVRAPGGAIQDLSASAAGAPQFAIGYRGERYGLGVGFGLTIARLSEKDTFGDSRFDQELTISLFQVGPSGWLDIWQSEDGRTRGHIAATVSFGRLSATEKDEFTFAGQPTQTSESKLKGSLLGVRVGIGGDHFLHPHFALGLEAGFQGMFGLDVEDESGGSDSFSLAANGAYAAMRLMLVF